MSRLIDADALITQIVVTTQEACMNMSWKQGMTYALGLVEAQPTITPEPHWISVTERLPEKNGEYIVTIQCEHVDGWDDYVTGFAEWDVDDWHLVSYYPGQIKAIAWCELPEPYKGVTK